jgi:TonB family protein
MAMSARHPLLVWAVRVACVCVCVCVCAALPAWAQSQKAQLQWSQPYEFPRAAIIAEEEGLVRVRIAVAADCSVQGVQVLRSSGYRSLDRYTVFMAQTARCQPARDAQGQPVSGTLDMENLYRLDPPLESADDQRQPIDERVRRRVLRNYPFAVVRAAARAGSAVSTPHAEIRWPAGQRVVFQAEVLPVGSLRNISLLSSSGSADLDNLAYDSLLGTRSLPLAQPIDAPITVQIELK